TIALPSSLFPPTNLAAKSVSSSEIDLSWTDNDARATGYQVESSPDGVTWSVIASLGANSTSYADTTLAAATTCSYRVQAVSATASPSYSNTATGTTLTVAPAGLTASAAAWNQVNLSWGDVVGETGFAIQRSRDGLSWGTIGTTGAGVTSYQDSTV